MERMRYADKLLMALKDEIVKGDYIEFNLNVFEKENKKIKKREPNWAYGRVTRMWRSSFGSGGKKTLKKVKWDEKSLSEIGISIWGVEKKCSFSRYKLTGKWVPNNIRKVMEPDLSRIDEEKNIKFVQKF